MNKPFTRRYQIWTLAPQGETTLENSQLVPSRWNRGDEAKKRHAGIDRPDLLYADSGLARSRAEIEDAAASLYRYGLPIEIELPGFCTMPNGRSSVCRTRKISSDSADFLYGTGLGDDRFRLFEEMAGGSIIRLDLEQIGKFRGALTAQNPSGFQIAVDVYFKDMLSTKLGRLAAAMRSAGCDASCVPAKPKIVRIEPDTKSCSFVDHIGTLRKGTLINVSQIDALIKTAVIPPVGARIIFGGPGRHVAEVTRGFEIGFAVNFCPPIPAAEFSAAIKFLDG